MPAAFARILVAIVELYAGAGILFALAFVTVGVGRVDDHAREAGWGFRLLILPGSALFWPLLAARWLGRRAS